MTTPHLLPDRRSPPSSNEPVALVPSMVDAISRAHAFAPAATPVILHGESGTGKTFFAEYIHRLSGRVGTFLAFSVGMFTPQLALDDLFGHVPGAYTDARKMRSGRMAAAAGGTLLLDDVQNLDLSVQKQLLQVLDRGTYSPVGSDRILSVGCRIILAMSEDPERLMRQGQLLKDLRYRFGACAIRIPSLSERTEEIPLLAHRALERCPETTRVSGPAHISEAALAALKKGEYSGNVRQLTAAIEYAYLIARAANASEIGEAHLPDGLCPPPHYHRWGDRAANRLAVDRALKQTGGNVKKAAQILGISRNAVHAIMGRDRVTSSTS